MDDFKVFYDEEEDILYLAKAGNESQVVEVSPGVNMELDGNGNLIGVEVFKASLMFKNARTSAQPCGKVRFYGFSKVPPVV